MSGPAGSPPRWPLTLLTGPLLLLTPFLIFVRHNGYGLLRPESLACLSGLAGVGLALGALMALGGWRVQVAVSAALVTLFVDVQTKWFAGWGVPLAATFGAALAAAWLLRRDLSSLAVLVLGSMLVVTLLTPAATEPDMADSGASTAAGRADLPLVLHIVLDQQIGIEGIPREFDPEGRLARSLEEFYLSRGFELFGKAYTRYHNTVPSLAHLVNFSDEMGVRTFVAWDWDRIPVTRNAYFEEMTRRGYTLHVYQSSYMNFCRSAGQIAIGSCHTYDSARMRSIEELSLSVPEKVRLIAAMYTRRSFLLSQVQEAYQRLRARGGEWAAALPAWDSPWVGGSISGMAALDRLRQDLARAGPGAMFFAHILLPHGPFAFDASCTLRPSARSWLLEADPLVRPRSNTPESRALRYPLYLDQVSCVHRKLGELLASIPSDRLRDALVIVHGDHGSRIGLAPPLEILDHDLRPPDYVDAFSTIFAVKRPGAPARYDERLLPLEVLLAMAIGRTDALPDQAPPPPPRVYLSRGLIHYVPRPMPDFLDGAAVVPRP